MKQFICVLLTLAVLVGCTLVPNVGVARWAYSSNIQVAIDGYNETIDFAQSSISYAQCLDKVAVPLAAMEDPENEMLQVLIPQFTKTVLEETVINNKPYNLLLTDCPVGAPESFVCPRLTVTYPSFATFITESESVVASLKTRLEQGITSLASNDPEMKVMERHRKGLWQHNHFNLPDVFRSYKLTAAANTLPLEDGVSAMSREASHISKLALQASYFSDDLDYQSIYECSKIDGNRDPRFSGSNLLAYEDARSQVDFSTMSIEDRKVKSRDKLYNAYDRYDDAKKTIKTLEKLF